MEKGRYDPDTVLDVIGLQKELSEVNKLRHKYWNQARYVRFLLGRYIAHHRKPQKTFVKTMENFPSEKREFYEYERDAAKRIPVEELRGLLDTADRLFRKPLTVDFLQRMGAEFLPGTCQNCGLPLTGQRRKFHSDQCSNQYRKRKWIREKRRGAKSKTGSHSTNEKKKVILPNGCNPTQGDGERNFSCSEYKQCLDKALDWQSFHCEKCNLRKIV